MRRYRACQRSERLHRDSAAAGGTPQSPGAVDSWFRARLVLIVDDCRAACDRMRACGVKFTLEPIDRYGAVDASFRDPSGNGWKMIEARR